MTTTTGDPSSLKTPATLSGGDLVSRFLAATPPYLYNVPLTPHSFFFSEMLRSFVQSKAEAGTAGTSNAGSVVRRRKRTWRDARERPLELTTTTTTTSKEKPHHHLHHHHHHHHQDHPNHHQNHHHNQQKDKYYGIQQPRQQQQQTQPEVHAENRFKSHDTTEETSSYGNESVHKRSSSYEQKSNPYTMMEPLKPIDDNRPDFCKQNRDFYDDSSRRFSSEQTAHQVAIFAAASQKIKPEEPPQQQQSLRETSDETKKRDSTPDRTSINDDRAKIVNQDMSFLTDQKNKLQELAGRNFLPGITGLPRLDEQAKNFGLAAVPNTTDFLPSGPLWYPPYPAIPQSYPAIDPLHFFIDLRVSGHIWDRKMNERQLPFKSKHCSAFSVPQAKEYNRPLDLTRDEATTSSTTSRNNLNQRGTHFIMKNLNDTYKDIRGMDKSCNNVVDSAPKSPNSDDNNSKDCQGRSLSKNDASSYSSSSRDHRQQREEENEGKDLRALIGLELVVDYVKEPKEDSNVDGEQTPDVGE